MLARRKSASYLASENVGNERRDVPVFLSATAAALAVEAPCFRFGAVVVPEDNAVKPAGIMAVKPVDGSELEAVRGAYRRAPMPGALGHRSPPLGSSEEFCPELPLKGENIVAMHSSGASGSRSFSDEQRGPAGAKGIRVDAGDRGSTSIPRLATVVDYLDLPSQNNMFMVFGATTRQ